MPAPRMPQYNNDSCPGVPLVVLKKKVCQQQFIILLFGWINEFKRAPSHLGINLKAPNNYVKVGVAVYDSVLEKPDMIRAALQSCIH